MRADRLRRFNPLVLFAPAFPRLQPTDFYLFKTVQMDRPPFFPLTFQILYSFVQTLSPTRDFVSEMLKRETGLRQLRPFFVGSLEAISHLNPVLLFGWNLQVVLITPFAPILLVFF